MGIQVFTSVPLPDGYGELPGSPQESLGEHGWEATVELLVPWDKRTAVLEDILMNNKVYPHMRGLSGAYAISGGSKPYQDPAQQDSGAKDAAAYPAAHLTIKYGRTKHNTNNKGQELYSESLDFQDHHVTMPPLAYQWNHNGADTKRAAPAREVSGGMVQKGFEYTQVRYNQKQVPTSIMGLLGTTNATGFQSPMLGLWIPMESMLFSPPRLNRKVMSTGAGLWTITYKVGGKLPGWNYFWNPDGLNNATGKYTGAWEHIYKAGDNAGGGTPVKFFPPADWSSVFIS